LADVISGDLSAGGIDPDAVRVVNEAISRDHHVIVGARPGGAQGTGIIAKLIADHD